MAVTIAAQATTITREDLKNGGWNDEAIDRLLSLSERYPFVEFLDSESEWQWLRFLKWLRGQGCMAESDPGPMPPTS
jgi:hypothetical protein